MYILIKSSLIFQLTMSFVFIILPVSSVMGKRRDTWTDVHGSRNVCQLSGWVVAISC
jgi:hypothetical protein